VPSRTAHAGVASEAFRRVGEALAQTWPVIRATIPPCTVAQQRNLLLDACGSDYRPLIELMLTVEPSLRTQMAQLVPTASTAQWEATRAPVVHQLVATRYLQYDVARWAVDVWGSVLGVAPSALHAPRLDTARGDGPDAASGSTAPSTEAMVPTHARTGSGNGTVRGGATRRAAATPVSPIATPGKRGTLPTARANAPSWAGGPATLRVGARGNPAARALLAQSGRLVRPARGLAGPRYQPIERMAAMVLGGLLLIVTVSLSRAVSAKRREAATRVERIEVPVIAAPLARSAAPVVRAAVPGALAGDDQGNTRRAVPDSLSAATPDSRTLAERPVPAATMPQTPPHALARALRDNGVRQSGVAGQYRVQQRILSVDGTSNCEAVATALGVGRESDETVVHAAGDTVFQMPARGVWGTMTADGYFVVAPRAGTTNNIAWRFLMQGRFSRTGFTGETQTYTEANLGWRKTQICVVTADLAARRLSP